MKPTLLHAALGAVFAATATMASLAVAAPPAIIVGKAPLTAPPATPPGKNKLKCFDGPSDETEFGGSCRIVGRGAMGPAILDLTSDDPEGSYAGVYYQESSINGAPLGDIEQLRYHYVATDDEILPGNLSLNIPIDEDGDGVFEFDDPVAPEQFAFIDAYYCPGTDGVVDAIEDEACGIWYKNVQYPNWEAFVDFMESTHPDALVAEDQLAFVVAERTPTDGPASYRVGAVKIGKPGR